MSAASPRLFERKTLRVKRVSRTRSETQVSAATVARPSLTLQNWKTKGKQRAYRASWESKCVRLKVDVLAGVPPTTSSVLCHTLPQSNLFQAVDHSASVSMKNAASCEKFCELQTHRTLTLRTRIAALDYSFLATSVRGSYSNHSTLHCGPLWVH